MEKHPSELDTLTLLCVLFSVAKEVCRQFDPVVEQGQATEYFSDDIGVRSDGVALLPSSPPYPPPETLKKRLLKRAIAVTFCGVRQQMMQLHLGKSLEEVELVLAVVAIYIDRIPAGVCSTSHGSCL